MNKLDDAIQFVSELELIEECKMKEVSALMIWTPDNSSSEGGRTTVREKNNFLWSRKYLVNWDYLNWGKMNVGIRLENTA